MYSRIIKYPDNKSFFLFGPRGTGKTTWVKQVFPNAVYLDLLESRLFNDLLADPQRLENFIPDNFKDWIIIDEVQKIPELLNEVHRLIEKNKYKFILTGSSARKLRRKGPNLLAGRALNYSMHPLTAIELGKDFNLNHSLMFGNLPSVYVESNPGDYLESYIKTYLQEEIQQEGLTRNLGGFSRFLEAASFSQGSVLNISQVSRECAVERKTVENYFTILEDLLLAYRVPVFTKRAKRRLVLHPKFYFFDVGVYRTLRPMGPLDTPEEAGGISFESLFFQELVAMNNYLGLGYKIYYWKTSNNIEVDFVLYGDRGLKIFEVKRKGKITGSDLRGLKAFLNDYPSAKAYLIYGGERQMSDGSINILPLEYAIKNLEVIL
ncbi:MAG: ATP-binding protein [Candidatus Hydromicrobium sp.]|nr:ATP-binding protein [Candidatus Hydromicrobium sp.]